MVMDATFYTFFNINDNYGGVTWTIVIEYILSAFVYLLAAAMITYPTRGFYIFSLIFGVHGIIYLIQFQTNFFGSLSNPSEIKIS
jgi:uncharacterized membrane protein HdeD (DUF308 family)